MGRCHPEVLSTDVWTSTDKRLQVRIRLGYLLKKVLDIRSGEFRRDLMKSFSCQEDAATVELWTRQRCQLDLSTMFG
jgi:hypothetical protein